MRQVTVHTAHVIPERAPIRVGIGEEVQIGERDSDWPEFVFVTADGGSGWVPARHLDIEGDRGVVHTPYDTTELPTNVGDVLDVVVEDEQSGWVWCQAASGDQGWVPLRTVTES
ncbi:MAG TPA: SH3 domain-containing protein [Acidimicrobiia bacterium]|jgi:hypothetical protein|nr:SH3 domain-containing protein [Acidimicrobiia bacterium]